MRVYMHVCSKIYPSIHSRLWPQAFENAMLGPAAVPLRVIIPRVQQVRADMLRAALHTHLLPLFSVTAAMTAVCCSPNKASELVQTFQELGRPVLQPQTLDEAIAL